MRPLSRFVLFLHRECPIAYWPTVRSEWRLYDLRDTAVPIRGSRPGAFPCFVRTIRGKPVQFTSHGKEQRWMHIPARGGRLV
jgi:hypothetical protein